MDMKNIFLHGELDKKIYMNQTNGLGNEVESLVSICEV